MPFEEQFLDTFFSYLNLQIKQIIFSKILTIPSLYHIQVTQVMKQKRCVEVDFDISKLFEYMHELGNAYQIEKAKKIAKEIIFWDASEIWIEYLSSPELRAHILSLLKANHPILNELEQQLLHDNTRYPLITLLCQLPQEKIMHIVNLICELKNNPDLLETINDAKIHSIEEEFLHNIERIREEVSSLPCQLKRKLTEIGALRDRLHLDMLAINTSAHHLISHMIRILKSDNLSKMISLHSEILANEQNLEQALESSDEEIFEQFVFLEDNEEDIFQIHLFSPLILANFSGKFEELMALYQIIDLNKDRIEYPAIEITSPVRP